MVKNRNCQSFGCMIICLVYSNFPVLYCCKFIHSKMKSKFPLDIFFPPKNSLEVNILTHLYHTVFVIKLLFLHKYLSFEDSINMFEERKRAQNSSVIGSSQFIISSIIFLRLVYKCNNFCCTSFLELFITKFTNSL